MLALEPIPLEAIRAAAERNAPYVLRTPLVRLEQEQSPAEIYLKLENLQPIGSFKLRGASNAIGEAPREELARGVWTASAGNMAQGVAWQARRLGLDCTVVAPDHAPEAKLAAIRRLGARIIKLPFEEWFQVLATREHPGMEGLFVHPVSDPAVMAGNGTIALEILEQLPEVDTVIAGFGGGGLSCGIASALSALAPHVRVLAAEVESAAPLTAAWQAGKPVPITYRASFVDGIGAPFVLEDMWPLARRLLAGTRVVTLEETAAAIRLIAERAHVIAEGAGAAPVAAALKGEPAGQRVVCVISGGNIEPKKLAAILSGGMP